jgi:hypothetical protein
MNKTIKCRTKEDPFPVTLRPNDLVTFTFPLHIKHDICGMTLEVIAEVEFINDDGVLRNCRAIGVQSVNNIAVKSFHDDEHCPCAHSHGHVDLTLK